MILISVRLDTADPKIHFFNNLEHRAENDCPREGGDANRNSANNDATPNTNY